MRKVYNRSTKRFTRVRSNAKIPVYVFACVMMYVMMLPCSARPDVGKTIRSHLGRLQDDRERQSMNDRKTGTTGPAPCLDLNPRRAAGSGRSRLRRRGTRSIRRRISWRRTGWPYPSARPCCPGTSSGWDCSGWSDGTLGGNGRPSATAHHCCMCRRFPFRHQRLSIRIGGRGGGRDRDHRP